MIMIVMSLVETKPKRSPWHCIFGGSLLEGATVLHVTNNNDYNVNNK